MSFDRGPNAQGRFNLGGNTHLALANPGDTSSARLDSVIKDFTAYQVLRLRALLQVVAVVVVAETLSVLAEVRRLH